MKQGWAFVLLLLAAPAFAEESPYCSIAADRSTEIYDYLYLHIPQMEHDIGVLQLRGDLNQTAIFDEMRGDFQQMDKSQKAYMDQKFEETNLRSLLYGALGIIIGGASVFSLKNWGGD